MVVLIAIAVMMGATIAVHIGLPQAISGVVGKVCKCHKCLTFWSVFVVLLLIGCNIIVAAMLSLIASYMSNWFGLLLVWLNEIYEWIWQKLNEK